MLRFFKSEFPPLLDYTRCLMFYFELYPLYDNPTAANSLEAYMRHTPGLISSGDIDLAFLKPISASSSFAGYNPPSLLVSLLTRCTVMF